MPNSLFMDAWTFLTKSFFWSYLNSISSYLPSKGTNRPLVPSVRTFNVVYVSKINIPLGEILANSWFWKYLFPFAFPKWRVLRHVLWKRSNLNPYLEIQYRLNRLNKYFFIFCSIKHFYNAIVNLFFLKKKFDSWCILFSFFLLLARCFTSLENNINTS